MTVNGKDVASIPRGTHELKGLFTEHFLSLRTRRRRVALDAASGQRPVVTTHNSRSFALPKLTSLVLEVFTQLLRARPSRATNLQQLNGFCCKRC
jgi:hypothetical protein